MREELASFCLKELHHVCWNGNRGKIRARFNSKGQQVTILQCYAPTNYAKEANDDFCDQLQIVSEQVRCRNIKRVIEHENAKVGM